MHVALDANPRSPSAPTEVPPLLYRHRKREQWGLAVIVWERDGKRGYRFEGGSERTFKEGYYHLFESAPAVGDAAERLLASLTPQTKADPSAARRARQAALPTLAELVAVFREEYPGGFGDARWVARVRGEGVSRRAKCHREAAIAEAAELLSKEALDGLLAEGNATEVVRRAIEVLAATDLVTKAQLQPLRTLAPTTELATALRNLMHEPDADGAHFDRLVRRLGRAPKGKPSWPLLTALRALVDPKGDVCVRPSVFRAMAEVVTPSLSRRVRPHGGYYNRCVAMVRDLREELAAMGEPARDLFDVYDFIWTVCRPAAGKVLARVRQRAAMPAEAEVEVSAPEPASNDATMIEAEAACNDAAAKGAPAEVETTRHDAAIGVASAVVEAACNDAAAEVAPAEVEAA